MTFAFPVYGRPLCEISHSITRMTQSTFPSFQVQKGEIINLLFSTISFASEWIIHRFLSLKNLRLQSTCSLQFNKDGGKSREIQNVTTFSRRLCSLSGVAEICLHVFNVEITISACLLTDCYHFTLQGDWSVNCDVCEFLGNCAFSLFMLTSRNTPNGKNCSPSARLSLCCHDTIRRKQILIHFMGVTSFVCTFFGIPFFACYCSSFLWL